MSSTTRLPFRLIVASNRGPYHLHQTKRGLKREKTVGGLVTSLLPMLETLGGVWIAWGDPPGRYEGSTNKSGFSLRYMLLTPDQVRLYYHGLSNSALWPLCHYFLGRAQYESAQWQAYEQVNQQFADIILEEAGEEDVIWVHDYQLACVPSCVRSARPDARLAFFWHIPFPAVEVFRTFPWRELILRGLLASDLLGFHIPEYVENFAETVQELLGATIEGNRVHFEGRTIQLMAHPIGIDYRGVNRQAHSVRTERRVQEIRQSLGEQTLILGVERMDYTKGILERLRAMEHLLDHHPQLHGKVTLIQIVTPSRTEVEAYRLRKREIDEIVGRINGRFSDGFWVPIRYLYRAVSLSELSAYYRAADIALVTPLRDGLNLIAKEYVASRVDGDGVLILSEFAGAAYQLPEALLVNPYSIEDLSAALARALTMPRDEQMRLMQAMQSRIAIEDISWWARGFLECMVETVTQERHGAPA